jgi:N-hydroxyarylamine O-acetyltransferase
MMGAGGLTEAGSPLLDNELLERVLERLGFDGRPALDLPGLTRLFEAYWSAIPFDNIRKRIWFEGDRSGTLPGGDPTDLFEHWLAHGTGGTCWPVNGGFLGLVQCLGYDARGIAGTCASDESRRAGLDQINHGSVVVKFDGTDHLFDHNLGSPAPLRLVPGRSSAAGPPLHEIVAVPREDGFDISFRSGTNREKASAFNVRSGHDPVDRRFFRERYDASKSNEVSPFNAALYITKRSADSIVTIGRLKRLVVGSDDVLVRSELTDDDRRRALVEEFGISEAVVDRLPPDRDEPNPFY